MTRKPKLLGYLLTINGKIAEFVADDYDPKGHAVLSDDGKTTLVKPTEKAYAAARAAIKRDKRRDGWVHYDYRLIRVVEGK